MSQEEFDKAKARINQDCADARNRAFDEYQDVVAKEWHRLMAALRLADEDAKILISAAAKKHGVEL